jgi:hypothetical protein
MKAITFTLQITLGNDAMRTPRHVAAALRAVAKTVASHQSVGVFEQLRSIMDVNGNSVGRWEFAAEDAERAYRCVKGHALTCDICADNIPADANAEDGTEAAREDYRALSPEDRAIMDALPSGDAEAIFARAQMAQTAFWQVLKELEAATGAEIESSDDLSELDYAAMLKKYPSWGFNR